MPDIVLYTVNVIYFSIKYIPLMVASSSSTLQMVKREPTSLNIDPELWRQVRKTAIDMGITATEFFEQALREKLARVSKK
jgi:hypothetical protein